MKITKQGLENFKNASKRIAIAAIKGDEVLVTPDVKRYRLDICKPCEHNKNNQCQICECLVIAKTILATENCPKGKW